MAGISIQTAGSIVVTDGSTGVTAFQKVLSNLIFTGLIWVENSGGTLGTSPVDITHGISPVNFIWFHNLDLVNSVTLVGTPNGGSSATLQTLEPGGFFMVCQQNTGGGYTALTAAASGTTTSIEYIVAG